MEIKKQRELILLNKCDAIYHEDEVKAALLWWAGKPICQERSIFLAGAYPLVTTYRRRMHLHRLLMSWKVGRKLESSEYVHHRNGNKRDARLSNLVLLDGPSHQRFHNTGKKVSDDTRKKMSAATTRQWDAGLFGPRKTPRYAA